MYTEKISPRPSDIIRFSLKLQSVVLVTFSLPTSLYEVTIHKHFFKVENPRRIFHLKLTFLFSKYIQYCTYKYNKKLQSSVYDDATPLCPNNTTNTQ